MTLEEARAHIGAGVVYDPKFGLPKEDGVITSVNDTYVFVRYSVQGRGIATYPEDLSLLTEATS